AGPGPRRAASGGPGRRSATAPGTRRPPGRARRRSEEHTSELQSLTNLVCRLLLEKKKNEERRSDRTWTRHTARTLLSAHAARARRRLRTSDRCVAASAWRCCIRPSRCLCFFSRPPPPLLSSLSLHDALPI